MKILLVNKYFYIKGGAENSFFQMAKLLQKKEHQIAYFSMKDKKNFPSDYEQYFMSNIDLNENNINNMLKVPGRLLYSLEAKKKIEQIIEKERPDIAHLNNIYHQISPSILHSLKKHKIPIVLTLRDYKIVCGSYAMLDQGKVCEACQEGRYYNCFIKGCVKGSRVKSLLNTTEMYLHHKLLNIYNIVDIYISPSLFLKNKVGEMGFKGKVVHLPNFVSLDDYVPQHQVAEDSFVYFGRLSAEKGLATLLEAMKGVKARLKLIGEGPLKEDLQLKVKEWGMTNVEFLGFKTGEELKSEVKKSLAVIVPSEWYENNPRSVIEGFALGKPAIGARIGGIPELVRDNETGYIFESGNVNELKAKIVRMLADPDHVKVMGRNARTFVEKNLESEKHYLGLMNVYSEAIAKHQ